MMSEPVEYTKQMHKASDGMGIWVRRWSPAQGDSVAELLVLHGYGEHGGRYRELAHRLAVDKIATTAIDVRGHGRSEGRRGHVDLFANYHWDVDVGLLALEKGPPRFVLAHSHGGLIALDYLAKHDAQISGLILSNPFIDVAMEVPKIKLLVGKIAGELLPRLSLPRGEIGEGLSHDPLVGEQYARDPLVFHTVTAGWYREATRAQTRAQQMTELHMPVLYFYSDEDPVATPATNAILSSRLKAPEKMVRLREGEYHEILNEVGRAEVQDEISTWIQRHSSNGD